MKTYLPQTVRLRDGLPAVCIDWEAGVVREPRIVEVPSSWRLPEIKTRVVDLHDTERSVVTPIPEYEVYPAFFCYLVDLTLLSRWKEAGGKIPEF